MKPETGRRLLVVAAAPVQQARAQCSEFEHAPQLQLETHRSRHESQCYNKCMGNACVSPPPAPPAHNTRRALNDAPPAIPTSYSGVKIDGKPIELYAALHFDDVHPGSLSTLVIQPTDRAFEPTLAELRVKNPDVYAAYMRRLDKAHAEYMRTVGAAKASGSKPIAGDEDIDYYPERVCKKAPGLGGEFGLGAAPPSSGSDADASGVNSDAAAGDAAAASASTSATAAAGEARV